MGGAVAILPFILVIADDEIFDLLHVLVAFSNHLQSIVVALFDIDRIILQQSYAPQYRLRRQVYRILYWLPS